MNAGKARLDVLVFMGRFQPLHIGHQFVIDQALQRADHVILLVGSSNVARNPRNPSTVEERIGMIRATWSAESASKRLLTYPLNDRLYNDTAWVTGVQNAVRETLAANPELKKNPRIGLIGYGKDNTSYYLKMFPDWEAVDVPSQYGTFNATEIRDAFIQANPVLPVDSCPEPVVDFMRQFRLTDTFKDLLTEANFIREYKRRWSNAPFPPTLVTVDAVVEQSGHVLLIERARWPGKGLWALPGGFLEKDETLRDAVVRELAEETRLSDKHGQIPKGKLGSYVEDNATRVFDDPHRSLRGRTITHAFLFRLPRERTKFTIEGSDDAAKAFWAPISEIDPRRMYEDHFFILETMLRL
jgi:bifunctional NMN adenylyltransferase/nudix hydrolase